MPRTDRFGEPEDVVVTQIRSGIGEPPKVRGTLRALGLRHIGDQKVHSMGPSLQGMLRRVRHLIRVDPSLSIRGGDLPSYEVDADSDGVLLRFRTQMKQRQADATLHRIVTMDAEIAGTGKGRSFALRWDEGEGVLRTYTAAPPARPWIKGTNFERFALLRIDIDDGLSVGLEPSLEHPDEKVEVFIHSDVPSVERAMRLAQALRAPRSLIAEVERVIDKVDRTAKKPPNG